MAKKLISPCSLDREAMTEFFKQLGIGYSSQIIVEEDGTCNFNFVKDFLKFQNQAYEEMLRDTIESRQGRKKEILAFAEKYSDRIVNGEVAPLTIAHTNEEFGFGCFAAEDIPAGTFIGEYTGEVCYDKKNPSDEYQLAYVPKDHNSLMFFVHSYWQLPRFEQSLSVIDAHLKGNETRFINYTPKTLDVVADDGSKRKAMNVFGEYGFVDGLWHFVLRSIRDIEAGEEIRGDFYGKEYFKGAHSTDVFALKGGRVVQVESEYNSKRVAWEKGFEEYGLNWLI